MITRLQGIIRKPYHSIFLKASFSSSTASTSPPLPTTTTQTPPDYDSIETKVMQEKFKLIENEEKILENKKKNLYLNDKERMLPRVPSFIAPWQRVWFPNERIILVKPKTLDVTCTELLFKLSPKLTKHEIKDLLRAVYGFDVKNVQTHIRLGKVKNPVGMTNKAEQYRRPTYKYAKVTLHSPERFQQPSNQRDVERMRKQEITKNKELEEAGVRFPKQPFPEVTDPEIRRLMKQEGLKFKPPKAVEKLMEKKKTT